MLRRHEGEGRVVWSSTLNGERCDFVTDDPTLVVTEQGIANSDLVGVELVDQDGVRRAWSVRSA